MAKSETAIRLTLQDRRELQSLASSSDRPAQAGLRATVILMSAEGTGAESIARTLGISLRTVRRTRRRWRRKGFKGLYDRKRSGRPARADKKYLRMLYRVVRTDPRKLGYCFAHWTAPRLAEYLKQQTGVRLCDDWVRMLLKSRGFVWRKTKLTIRNKQDDREKKDGPETPLEASGGDFTSGSEIRTLVRGRSLLRSATSHDPRLPTSRRAAANRNARQESPSRGLRSLPLS